VTTDDTREWADQFYTGRTARPRVGDAVRGSDGTERLGVIASIDERTHNGVPLAQVRDDARETRGYWLPNLRPYPMGEPTAAERAAIVDEVQRAELRAATARA